MRPPSTDGYDCPVDRDLRLYTTLKGMGLNVQAFPDTEQPLKVGFLAVSVGLLPSGIGTPLERTEVSKVVRAAILDSDNVIDFPAVD